MADGAQNGDTVQVHYTGRLDNGDVFDSSDGGEPLEFQVGAGQVIPGFDEGVRGMTVGAKKTVEIEADDAYGPRAEQLINTIPRAGINLGDAKPEVGLSLIMHIADGQEIPVTITAVTATHVTLDANHPLAGQKLIFEIERVK